MQRGTSAKAPARIEFGKFNFESNFDHCRSYIKRFSTTIYDVYSRPACLICSKVFDLFFVPDFFGFAAIFVDAAGDRSGPFPFR